MFKFIHLKYVEYILKKLFKKLRGVTITLVDKGTCGKQLS